MSLSKSDQKGSLLPRLAFVFALIFFSVLYGMVAGANRLFPYDMLINAGAGLKSLLPDYKPFHWYYIESEQTDPVPVADAGAMAAGLTKLVSVEGDNTLGVKVIDAQGEVHQNWNIEWSDVWPYPPDYLEWQEVPKDRPGTHIHGAEILANGDLVFNFEHLGLVRMNACGGVEWQLPFRTHHSVFVAEDQTLWVSAQINHLEYDEQLPLYLPNYIEPVILQVSPEGEILQQKSVFDLLIDNDLEGALYSQASDNWKPVSRGDTLHLNDVEVFPESMEPGFFKPGDIMISLRNINTVLVFDLNWKLKYQLANAFVRQHDPDFISGDEISIFDNHNTAPEDPEVPVHSRILINKAPGVGVEVAFEGNEETPFFTNIMGKHQWLENGNLLISESRFGRALEVDPTGKTIWEFYNIVEPGWLGIIEEVERLSPNLDERFFAKARQRCEDLSS